MCTLNLCKDGFQFSFAPTTPSEESLLIKRSKKRLTRTHIRLRDQWVQFEAIRCVQILIDRRVSGRVPDNAEGDDRQRKCQTASSWSAGSNDKEIWPGRSFWSICTLSPDVSDLVNMSTGTVAPPAVVKDILRAFEVGEEAYHSFKRTILDDDPPSVKFHDNMTKQRLKTFSTISAKSYRMKGQTVVLKAPRNLFSQMILVAESRGCKHEGCPLGPLPWALANADWSLRKTNKAAFTRKLEKKRISCRRYPKSINLYHWWDMFGTKGWTATTKHLHNCQSVLSIVMYVGGQSGRVDVVSDVYHHRPSKILKA